MSQLYRIAQLNWGNDSPFKGPYADGHAETFYVIRPLDPPEGDPNYAVVLQIDKCEKETIGLTTTLKAAKRAAQSHFERRIAEYLEPAEES